MATVILHCNSYYRAVLGDPCLSQGPYVGISVNAFPARDLPSIFYDCEDETPVHSAHTLVLGSSQAGALGPFSIPQPNPVENFPILCDPSTGLIYVNPIQLDTVNQHSKILQACTTNTFAEWFNFWSDANHSRGLTRKYPVLWTPRLSVALVKIGSVVELIRYDLSYRYYAVITEVLVSDLSYTVLHAHLLGPPPGTHTP